jgi:hypothetical protein
VRHKGCAPCGGEILVRCFRLALVATAEDALTTVDNLNLTHITVSGLIIILV